MRKIRTWYITWCDSRRRRKEHLRTIFEAKKIAQYKLIEMNVVA